MLAPLIGFGSNQVEKEIVIEHNADAYHVDEHKYQDAKNLHDCLLSMLHILLFLPPQMLSKKFPWLPTVKRFAKRCFISLF